jgi:hypothetical protein
MNSIVSRFMAVWMHPLDAMNAVKQEGEEIGIVPSMIFVLIMGALSAVIAGTLSSIIPGAVPPNMTKGMIWTSALFVFLFSFVGSFLLAFFIWWLVNGILKGTMAEYKITYRFLALLAAFYPVAALLSPIPKVGPWLATAVNIWSTIILIQGIIIVRDTQKVKTWVTCVILFLTLFTLAFFARLAAQRDFASGGGFNEFGASDFGGTDDLGATSDDLEQQLQGLADKAKADESAAPAKK